MCYEQRFVVARTHCGWEGAYDEVTTAAHTAPTLLSPSPSPTSNRPSLVRCVEVQQRAVVGVTVIVALASALPWSVSSSLAWYG